MKKLAWIGWIAAVIAIACIASPVAATPQQESPPERRFALGWDSGIGVRYRLDAKWGIGVRVNPSLDDDEDRTRRVTDDTPSSDFDVSREYGTIGASVMLYRETAIGRWLGVGPYLDLAYRDSRSTSHRDETYDAGLFDDGSARYSSAYEDRNRGWTVSGGLRPTFTFRRRFALESRFGVSLDFSDDRETYTSVQERDGPTGSESYWSTTTSKRDRWTFAFFGEELGPGAELSFMIYF